MSRKRRQRVTTAPSTNGHNRVNGQTVRRLSVAAPATATKTRGAIAKGQKPDKMDWVTLGTEIDGHNSFKMGSQAYKSIIANAEISIEGGSNDPKATMLTEHLIELWYKHLGQALHCFEHGRSVFEQVRPYDRDAALHLPELIHQPTKYCEMRLDEEGNYDGFTLKIQGTDPVTVSARESWWMALDPEPLNPHGQSRYVGDPYSVYRRIRRLEENQDTFSDQQALGQIAAFAPSQFPEGRYPGMEGDKGQIDEQGQPINLLQQMADALSEIKSGGQAVFDSGSWPGEMGGGPFYRIEAIPRATSLGPLETMEAILNDRALKSIGVPPRALTQEGEVGTNAQSVAHQRILIANASQILDQLVASFQEQVVDPAVQVNWPAGARPTLTLTYGNIDPSLVALALEIVRNTVGGQISPLITEGVLDFPKLLDQVRLPVGDNLPARLAAVKAASSPQPAPGGPMQFSQSRILNCGTGDGGFKSGNKCGGASGGGGAAGKMLDLSKSDPAEIDKILDGKPEELVVMSRGMPVVLEKQDLKIANRLTDSKHPDAKRMRKESFERNIETAKLRQEFETRLAAESDEEIRSFFADGFEDFDLDADTNSKIKKQHIDRETKALIERVKKRKEIIQKHSLSQSRRLSSPPAAIAKTQEAHEARTKREAASYWDQMFAALEGHIQLDDDGNFVGLDPEALRELEEIEHEIDDVRREGTVASAVSGYLTPFSADVQPEQVKRADTIEPDFVPRDTRTNPAQRAD